MKKIFFIVLVFTFFSCESDQITSTTIIAKPINQAQAEREGYKPTNQEPTAKNTSSQGDADEKNIIHFIKNNILQEESKQFSFPEKVGEALDRVQQKLNNSKFTNGDFELFRLEIKKLIAEAFSNGEVNDSSNNSQKWSPEKILSTIGSTAGLEFLIDTGTDLNGCEGLEAATNSASREIIELLFFQDLFKNIQCERPIILAAHRGQLAILKLFEEQGLDVVQNGEPLIWAIKGEQIAVVEYLLGLGTNPNIERSNAPILVAVEKNNLDIIKRLVNAGGDINLLSGRPIKTAIELGHLDILNYLLKAGANCEFQNESCVELAIREGDLKALAILVESGIDINSGNPNALEFAVQYENVAAIKFLLSKDAKIALNNYKSLQIAIDKRGPDLLEILVSKEDKSATDFLTEQLVQVTKKGGADARKLMALLISNGAIVNYQQNLPIRLAAANGFLDLCEELVASGAYLRANWNEALQKATENGHLEVVIFLLNNGADPKAINKKVIKNALINKHHEMILTLKDMKVIPEVSDSI